MKDSLNPKGTSRALLRMTRRVLPVLFAIGMATGCGPQGPQGGQLPQGTIQPAGSPAPQGTPAAQGSQSSLVGQWHTVLQGADVTITIEANGQYIQVGIPPNGGTKTAQGGPYQLVAPNSIIFRVTDWSPKTKVMYIPAPGPVPSVPNPVGPYPGPQGPQWQTYGIPKPPDSEYAYTFNGPNTMTLKNQVDTITFTRVTGR